MKLKNNEYLETTNDKILKDIGSLDSATEELNDYDFNDEELDADEVSNILTIFGKVLLAIFK